jgi:hypothetical protein
MTDSITDMVQCETPPPPPPPTTKTPPYTIVWTRVWPNDKTKPPRIAGEELHHVIPGATRIPPCTVRYILSPRSNTKYENLTEQIQNQVIMQLHQMDPTDTIANDVDISFLPAQTSHRGTKEFCMDLSVSTPNMFRQIHNMPIMDGEIECEIDGYGSPVPANVLIVKAINIPSQYDLIEAGEDLAAALKKYRLDTIEVWDIYARYQKYEGLTRLKTCGTLYACVHFKNRADPRQYPQRLIRETFPGWFKTFGRSFELSYAGKINYCYQCREKATKPHEEKDYTNIRCNSCYEKGHIRKNYSKYNTGNDPSEGTSATNKRTRFN